jgi:hypothetical protein
MHDQVRYQVRFDWGEPGARRITHGAHVVVLVDELDGHSSASAQHTAEAIVEVAPRGAAVVMATETSAADAAGVILRLQERLGERCVVAVVAAGSVDPDGFRITVEDQLAAGALVDALAALGIDFASPEAAVACASWQSLRLASSHLLTASTSADRLRDGVPGARAQRAAHPASAVVLREFSARG